MKIGYDGTDFLNQMQTPMCPELTRIAAEMANDAMRNIDGMAYWAMNNPMNYAKTAVPQELKLKRVEGRVIETPELEAPKHG